MTGLTGNNAITGAGYRTNQPPYEIDQSLRFEGSDNSDLSRTPSSASDRRTWTWSGWVKRSDVSANIKCMFSSYTGGNDNSRILFHTDYSLRVIEVVSNSTIYDVKTTQLFRDAGAWYHIVVAVDTTQSTASDRIKIYVNGSQVTDFATSSYPSLNYETMINNTGAHFVGNQSAAGGKDIDGYLAEVNFIDGQALTPASFGETDSDTNQWVPIKYTGSYGTNGFYLKFQDSSALGDDSSGNTNDFTPTNLAATDQVLDVPTNNFATLNPSAPPRASGSFTYSEGNLKVEMGGSGDADCPSTIGASSGKWYAEAYILTGDQSTNTPFVGLVSSKFLDNETIASSSNSCVYYYSGYTRTNGTLSGSAEFATYNAGDIIGIAFNANDNEVTFYKNNSSQGTKSLTSDEYVFISGKSGGTPVLVWNFGQDSSFANNKTSGAAGSDFYYTPPALFKALSTDNLPDPSIADPTAYFNTVLYTGNGATRNLTGVGFQPDFVWHKYRGGSGGHNLFDSVRGALKRLRSNDTSSEATGTDTLTGFISDGVSLGADTYGDGINISGYSNVIWNWKAGGTASNNEDGSITSSVSANTDAGFSIISYTGNGTNGATVGHGLSQKPDLVIYKARSQASHNWIVYSSPLGATKRLKLDLTDAESTSSSQFNDTEPTSSVVTLGTFNNINQSSETFIAYAFHSVDGYSKVGSYTGNGSSDGPFIYTGFRPAFVITKPYGSTGSWQMFDIARSPYNEMDERLRADTSGAEDTNLPRDFLSNGFKIRTNNATVNGSGVNLIYLAFAESPFKYSNAR